MSGPRTAPPKGFRRVERWFVGLAMAVVAFVLERVVIRAVRKKGGASEEEEREATTFTSKGGEVDLPDL